MVRTGPTSQAFLGEAQPCRTLPSGRVGPRLRSPPLTSPAPPAAPRCPGGAPAHPGGEPATALAGAGREPRESAALAPARNFSTHSAQRSGRCRASLEHFRCWASARSVARHRGGPHGGTDSMTPTEGRGVWMPFAAAAEEAGTSVHSVFRWAKAGRIQVRRYGKLKVVEVGAVRAFAARPRNAHAPTGADSVALASPPPSAAEFDALVRRVTALEHTLGHPPAPHPYPGRRGVRDGVRGVREQDPRAGRRRDRGRGECRARRARCGPRCGPTAG